MKHRPSRLVFLAAAAFILGGIRPTLAQAPATPAESSEARESTVYLSKDYTKALEADKLFDSDKFVARFVGFEADFAVFRQAGRTERIYVPKSAILYMRGPGEAKTVY